MYGLVTIACLATLFGFTVGIITIEVYNQSVGFGIISGALVAAIVSTTFSFYAFRKPCTKVHLGQRKKT